MSAIIRLVLLTQRRKAPAEAGAFSVHAAQRYGRQNNTSRKPRYVETVDSVEKTIGSEETRYLRYW